jgi:hypothetical protein
MPSWIEIASICLAALGVVLHLYSLFFPDGLFANRTRPPDPVTLGDINKAVERLNLLTEQVLATNSSLAELKISLEDIKRNQRLGEEPVDLVAQIRLRRSPRR